MINKNGNVLKGQHNLAQGKRRRSVALGCKTSKKIVREIAFIKEQFIFRTKKMNFISQAIIGLNSARNKFIVLIFISPRTVFLALPLSRATFRFVPPETLPWAELYWPFRPERYTDPDLYIKSRIHWGSLTLNPFRIFTKLQMSVYERFFV